MIKEKILIVSAPNPERHAGIAAKNIYDLFKKNGHETIIISKEENLNNPDFISFNSNKSSFFNKLINKVFNKKKFKSEYHFIRRRKYQKLDIVKLKKRIPFNPDIIFVLFPHNFVSYNNLYSLQRSFSARIIWQLVDMSSFTGGCHYSWDCLKYRSGCENCPAVLKKKYTALPLKTLKHNYEIIKNLDIKISIGSEWLFNHAKSSLLFKDKKIIKNYLYIDKLVFVPKTEEEKKEFKSLFGIPVNDFVIAFGAYSLNDKRKGIKFIIEALKYLRNHKDITLLVAGNGSNIIKTELREFNVISLGNIPRKELPYFYSSANLFLNASLQDVGPYMLLESLFCNTPVITFNTGFASEFVSNNGNIKYLLENQSSEEMAKSISKAYLEYKEKKELNVLNLEEIRARIDNNIIYKNYLKIFKNI